MTEYITFGLSFGLTFCLFIYSIVTNKAKLEALDEKDKQEKARREYEKRYWDSCREYETFKAAVNAAMFERHSKEQKAKIKKLLNK